MSATKVQAYPSSLVALNSQRQTGWRKYYVSRRRKKMGLEQLLEYINKFLLFGRKLVLRLSAFLSWDSE